ncbi:MAG TPA: hypothetical protein VNJ52_11675 [Patescibacteria group bacterium]|nr:hypothetical protein [Patescibacteria group bacterium]
MTIGAGFRCKDGVVLCADTQITWSGWYKRTASKITRVSTLNDRLIFVQAGVISSGKFMIEKLARAAQAENPKTITALESVLRKACHVVRQELKERYGPQLLLTVRTKDHAFLYAIEGYKLEPIQNTCCCIGTGAVVVNHLIERCYTPTMTIREAVFLAAYIAKDAKDFGSDVGGTTQIVTVPDGGAWDMVQSTEVARLEKDYESIERTMGSLLTQYSPIFTSSASKFERDLRRLTRQLRKAYKERGHLAGQREQEETNRRVEDEEIMQNE